MTRRVQREHVFKLLFRKDFHERSELEEQAGFYLSGEEALTEADREKIKERFFAMSKRQGEVDTLLANAASGWRLERMGRAELAIMRLAVYEMRFDEEVPDKVAINEAVELAKKYGEESAPGFINGVLAKLVREEAHDGTSDFYGESDKRTD